jgi:hypothetical protein
VRYRKVTKGGGMAFVREESGKEDLIATGAEALSLRMFFTHHGRSCDIEALHCTYEHGFREVTSIFDQAMLRNPPEDSSG